MKKLVFIFLFALPFLMNGQDSGLIWSIKLKDIQGIYDTQRIISYSDTNYIFINVNNGFFKVNSNTGQIVDSIIGKGKVFGISQDNKYILTHNNTLETIKKLDFNDYRELLEQTNLKGAAAINYTADGFIFAIKGGFAYYIYSENFVTSPPISFTHLGNAKSVSLSQASNYISIAYTVQSQEGMRTKYYTYVYVYDFNLNYIKNFFVVDGPYPVTHGFSKDGTVFFQQGMPISSLSIYETSTFNPIKYLDLKTNGYALLNDSQKVALFESKNLYILNLGDYSYSTCNVNKEITSLAVSDDNKYIYFYSYSDSSINKYRICSGVLDKEEKGINNSVTLSPNPASDYIEISYPPSEKRGLGGVSVAIFDVLGVEQCTLTPALSLKGEGVRIDVSGLPPGVYFVRVEDVVRKFVKW